MPMPKRLIDSLQRHAHLAEAEQAALAGALHAGRHVDSGADIAFEGEAADHCRVLLDGQAFRHRTLADGRRQILSFQVRGDVCDLQGQFLLMDHTVTALTDCEVGLIPRPRLAELLQAHPALANAFWRASFTEAAIFREWMVGMGRRTAYARIAHFFCEIVTKLTLVGLVRNGRCRFPITQQHLSDSLGLSTIHAHRTLQALRSSGLISFRAGELAVLDWPGLQAAGEFDPAYLHLRRAA